MGLAEELQSLERQRRAEIRTLHQTYLRTKRTVIRTASPSRIVRKHLGVTLAAAAALGMTMVPRPGAARPSGAAESAKSQSKWGLTGLLSRLKPVLQHVAPDVANYIPDAAAEPEPAAPPEETPPRKRSHKLLHMALMELAPLLLSKIDFRALLDQVMHLIMPREGGGEVEGEGGEHEPHMSVADFGTVKHSDYENFE